MFKLFKQAFSATPRQSYLNGLLQSAKWLGWDGQATPAPLPNAKPAQVTSPTIKADDEHLLAHPAANRKAA